MNEDLIIKDLIKDLIIKDLNEDLIIKDLIITNRKSKIKSKIEDLIIESKIEDLIITKRFERRSDNRRSDNEDLITKDLYKLQKIYNYKRFTERQIRLGKESLYIGPAGWPVLSPEQIIEAELNEKLREEINIKKDKNKFSINIILFLCFLISGILFYFTLNSSLLLLFLLSILLLTVKNEITL